MEIKNKLIGFFLGYMQHKIIIYKWLVLSTNLFQTQ
jgi:hypothetical protein